MSTAELVDLRSQINSNSARVAERLDRVCDVYKKYVSDYQDQWSRTKEIPVDMVERVTPKRVTSDVVTRFNELVLPVLRDMALRMYVDKGKWDTSDAQRRFDESLKIRLVQRVVPILQAGMSVDLVQYHSLQVRLAHINDHDGDALAGHAMNAVGVFMLNPISIWRAGMKVVDHLNGESPKDQLKNLLIIERDAIAAAIEKHIDEVRKMVMGLIASWLTDEIVPEIEVSARLNALVDSNAFLEKQISAKSSVDGHQKNSLPVELHYSAPLSNSTGFRASIIALLIVMTTAVVVGATILVMHTLHTP